MRLGSALLLLACAFTSSCTRKLAVTVELIEPESPDPFAGVSRVRMLALVAGRIEVAGEGRWDQGPFDLPAAIDPRVERLVVLGLDDSDRAISSGSTPPLDLLRSPPEGALRIHFSRIGELSALAARAQARSGGRAVQIDEERILFAGGTDPSGLPIETTEVATGVLEPLRPGPPLVGGRIGELQAIAIGDGQAMIIGGEPAARLAILDARANTARQVDSPFDASRSGASAVLVSDTLMIYGGGEDRDGNVLDEVVRFHPRTLELQAPGTLNEPRAESTAVLVSGDRVTFAGGRSAASDASALDHTINFDPLRGATSLSRIELNGALIAASAAVTGAGSVILAGGRGSGGEALDRVRALVVAPERAQSYGDTSTVAALPAPSAKGELIDLFDGSLLYLSPGGLTRISLLPPSAPAIEGAAEPMIGGRTIDGSVLLVAASGAMFSFNPGPQRVLGAFGIDFARPLQPSGVIPLRPSAWSIAEGRLTGKLRADQPSGGVIPGDVAVLGSSILRDFEVRFSLQLAPLAQASLVFGLDRGELDEVVFLGGITLVARLRTRSAESPIACNSVPTPVLGEPGPHPVRVRRLGDEVRVDADDDGTDELVCQTPDPIAGPIAFAVINGEAGFADLSINSFE